MPMLLEEAIRPLPRLLRHKRVLHQYGPTVGKQGSREAEKPGSREADTSGRLEAAKPGRQEATKPENPLPSPTSPRLETCGPAEHNASASAVLRLPASPLLHEAQKKKRFFSL